MQIKEPRTMRTFLKNRHREISPDIYIYQNTTAEKDVYIWDKSSVSNKKKELYTHKWKVWTRWKGYSDEGIRGAPPQNEARLSDSEKRSLYRYPGDYEEYPKKTPWWTRRAQAFTRSMYSIARTIKDNKKILLLGFLLALAGVLVGIFVPVALPYIIAIGAVTAGLAAAYTGLQYTIDTIAKIDHDVVTKGRGQSIAAAAIIGVLAVILMAAGAYVAVTFGVPLLLGALGLTTIGATAAGFTAVAIYAGAALIGSYTAFKIGQVALSLPLECCCEPKVSQPLEVGARAYRSHSSLSSYKPPTISDLAAHEQQEEGGYVHTYGTQ